ncbi:IMP dehydrogenase [Candidatus Woesearchaeota archaeon]|nr:IMP dehydrogenase [Candidatus Woesearchaeota archaeon]
MAGSGSRARVSSTKRSNRRRPAKGDLPGLSAEEFFLKEGSGKGYSFDDFNILDSIETEIGLDQISLETDLGKGVKLYIPVVAAPMDTVSEANLSIAIAQQGGISVIHHNQRDADNRFLLEEQISEIEKVKRHQSGFISQPMTVAPGMTIGEAREKGKRFMVSSERRPSGSGIIDTFPVTRDGTLDSELVGFLTRDCYFEDSDLDLKVGAKMYSLDELLRNGMVIRKSNVTEKQARRQMADRRIRHLLAITRAGKINYLVTRKDMVKNARFPHATRDDKGRLRVLFSVDTKDFVEPLERGFAAGADGVVVDTSQGLTMYAKKTMRFIKNHYSDKLIIGGNISTSAAARKLEKYGMDAYRCGQGVGSICTTQDTIGVGRAGATAIYDCARASRLAVIADGGIRGGGDIVKALALGAHAVMLGNLLARTDESPGELVETASGERMKKYRGMGSLEAMGGRSIRDYGVQAQGVTGYVRSKGSVHSFVPGLVNSVMKGLQALNCRNLRELHDYMRKGLIRFESREPGALVESKPHSLN